MAPIDKLSDDCLLEIFELLSPFDLFKMHRINRQFGRVAAVKLRTKIQAIALTRSVSNQIDSDFSLCTHLDVVRPDQVLVLDRLFKTLWKNNQPLHEPRMRALFLKIMTRCAGVRSIDFSELDLPDGLLLKVVKSCPEIECINLGWSVINEGEWNEILDLIGPKIVHFVKEKNFFFQRAVSKFETSMLVTVAEKCPNIKQVYWKSDKFKKDLNAAFKMLPKSCSIAYNCWNLNDNFEDIFDELETKNWSFISHRFERLSRLKITFDCDVEGVDFTGLKKLDVSEIRSAKRQLRFLAASRFPQLEELCFYARFDVTEDDYKNIFQRMKSIKKLTILLNNEYSPFGNRESSLPRSAIHELKKLEDIRFEIGEVRKYWQSKDFAEQLEKYVDEISSLKKLTVDTRNRFSNGWAQTIIKKLKELRLMQSRVEVDLVY